MFSYTGPFSALCLPPIDIIYCLRQTSFKIYFQLSDAIIHSIIYRRSEPMLVKSLLTQVCRQSNQGFNALVNTQVRQQLLANPNIDRSKLNALAHVITSLKNAEMQYLIELRNRDSRSIANDTVFSTSHRRADIFQFLYQKRWIGAEWKQGHVLSAVINLEMDDTDKEGAEVVKEIYEFELTSIDPAQKIKIIKVLRELLSLGLKEAKEIVDKAPTLIKKGKKEEGQKLKEDLAKNGCVVTLK